MIGISKLYCGTVEPSDPLRYNRKTSQMPSHLLQFSMDKKPIVVWNVTRRCNLHCIHCYSQSNDERFPDELKTDFALKVIEDLAEFGVPVILFSGGEPLLREDIFTLIEAAVENGIRTAVSTNGTVISADFARKMKHLGVSYVGVSLDGIGGTNDSFRGRKGAFNMALEGIRNCQQIGLKVGLRFTITNRNYREIPEIFSLLENANIDRVCFYHLVYSGRGSKLRENDLSDIETRQVVDQIIDLTADMHRRGLKKEVLTVDNHTDGVYLYLRMLRERNERAARVLELLKMNGGNSTGLGIGCISWDGSVHPDQFWRHFSLGNVRDKPFSEIWTDLSNPLLYRLRNRKRYLKGRCSICSWLDVCNGNFRVRAEAVTGDIWAEDPACYLTDEEIANRS